MADPAQGVSGATTGAVGGAAIGSAFPGVGTAVGAGIGAVLGGVSGLFGGGGGGTDSALRLPPELEVQYIQYFQQQMDAIQADYQQIGQITDIYRQQMSVYDATVAGTIPSDEALMHIRDLNTAIVGALGGDALQAVQQKFLDEDSAKSAGLIEEREGQLHNTLQNIAGGEVNSPELDRQHQQGRSQLEQDMARGNVPPAERAVRLAQFDQYAREESFNRSEGLKQIRYGQAIGGFQAGVGGIQSAAQLRLQARQFGLERATAGLNATTGALDFARQGTQQRSGFAGNVLQAGYGQLAYQENLRQEVQKGFGQMGQFRFSGTTRNALQSGLIGPGSLYQTTGVPRGDIGGYKNAVSGAERDAYRFSPSAGPSQGVSAPSRPLPDIYGNSGVSSTRMDLNRPVRRLTRQPGGYYG